MDLILPLQSGLAPVVDKKLWEQISSDKLMQSDERIRCMYEPWYWLVNWVWTVKRDESVSTPIVARFPALEYLRQVFHACFVNNFLAIDKSRQMRLTWVMMAYELWWAQFHKHEFITCQTKKEQDADVELIDRAHFMWEHQPAWLRPQCKRSFCKLEFPALKSVILGIPNGGDQIRSHNPSRHFGDECGFLEGEFEECRTAALACCRDIKLVSTANAGEFDDFINDRI